MKTTFKIWNVFASGTRVDCDLTPTAHFDIERGTKEMCEQVLQDIGAAGEVVDFAALQFCSPYFATSDATFRDRFRHAVHLSMQLAAPPAPVAAHTLFTTTARDLSASRDIDPFWTERRVVLIGDFTPEHWADSNVQSQLDALGGERTALTGAKLIQTRIDLGTHDLSKGDDKLFALQCALEGIADSAKFGKTMLLMLPPARRFPPIPP
jgi:hypothetical protein